MDRISELPDDILVHILSMLTMKEAGGTSVLSKRWRCVWAYVPVLNFDATKILEEMEDKPQEHMHLREVEGQKYLRWVDQVVTSHKAPTLHEFRVRFDFDEEKQSLRNIDNWVRCAMDKRVKRLEMDFSNCWGGLKFPCYTFPNLFPCNTLTSLELASVNVTGEVLERFLQICRCLEYLSVKYSESLVDLKVAGPLLNLKYLQVYQCFKIKQLVISAPNLTSFCYFGRQINVHFKSIPKLSKISIGNEYTDYLADNFSDFSSCAGQIEALYLMTMLDAQNFWKKNIVLPEFTRLEILEVKVYARDKQKLFCFYSLIKACPALKKFVLKLIMIDDFYKERKKTPLRKREARPHSQLKNVEIIGFNGHAIDLEFAISLMAIAVSLETMTIDPCLVHLKGTEWEFQVTERVIRAREQAQQLRAKLRPGTDLIIR